MKNEILRKEASKLIAQILVKSMARELEQDTKAEQFTIKNKKHFTSKKTRKLTSKQLINLSNMIVTQALKQELKFISYNLHKTYLQEPNNYEKIKKLEFNVNLTLDLMQKQKVELEQWEIENKTQKENDLQKEYNKYMYKNSKELFKHTKKGFKIVDNIDTQELKNTCIIMLLEYCKKYNNEIINFKKLIPFYILDKMIYKIQYLIQKIRKYNVNEIFTGNEKTYYLLEQKSFEIFQKPVHIEQKEQEQKHKKHQEAIRYIFSKLTLEQFKIYKLRLDNCSFQDIALKLDKNKSTIKTLYYRVVSYMQKDQKLFKIIQAL